MNNFFKFFVISVFMVCASTVCMAYGGSISGTVRYNNQDSTIIAFCKVILWDSIGNRIDSTYTQINGTYSLTNIPTGTYHLTAHPNQLWGGVNSEDALIIKQHFVELLSLEGLFRIAADVNNSSYINSSDALIVQKRFTQLISCFSVNDWISENKTVVTISNGGVFVNIHVICAGDVNGSYIPNYTASPCPSIPSFVYGGQTYNTIQIADQCWMKENLNIGTYREFHYTGLPHYEMSDNGIIEKYCSDNDSANCNVYGGLYEWNEMMQYSNTPGIQGICPPGWHIPSESEWINLINFLGGPNYAGGKMKETGFAHWMSPNYGATNESGFAALGSGTNYHSTSVSSVVRIHAVFWTSSEVDIDNALYHSLYNWYQSVGMPTIGDYKQYAHSVRCLKD